MTAEQALLEWLCTTIARDGGATLVTSLKDHYWPQSPKRLNALLIQSPIGKPKLLRFLEYHSPSIFQVDRNTIPHWVVLTDPSYSNPYIIISEPMTTMTTKTTTSNNAVIPNKKSMDEATARAMLRQKVLYILRRRQSRLNRRAQQDLANHQESQKVNLHWLIRQCPWELHFYLRAIDYYRQEVYHNHTSLQRPHPSMVNKDQMQSTTNATASATATAAGNTRRTLTTVHAVMSEPWQRIVLEPFWEFLLLHCANDLEGDHEQGKIWLKGLVSLAADTLDGKCNGAKLMDETLAKTVLPVVEVSDPTHHVRSLIPDTARHQAGMEDDGLEPVDWLDHLLAELFRLVQKDGATQVSLGLLLHRHASLKQILGGRDLWYLYQRHQRRFATSAGVLNVFQRPKGDGDVFLQWKPTLTKANTTQTNLNIPTSASPTQKNHPSEYSSAKHRQSGKPRMKVDTVGLFSVTNGRWANAIANIMIQCCQGSKVKWNISERTVIDMTASVGGMTLGLAKAKTRFAKILAMEIDETRANLCRENMLDHGISTDQVEVIHTDSVAAIPTFPNQCCILIDPPWGGEHYKEYKDQPPLLLGSWKLEDVLARIAEFVPICVVGMRLPVTLSVEHFLNEKLVRERGLHFDQLTIRKLSVQIFVVLKFG